MMQSLDNKKKTIIIGVVVVILLAAALAIGLSTGRKGSVPATPQPQNTVETTAAATETVAPTEAPVGSHHIESIVPALAQGEMKAGCETHAVCSLLKTLGYEIDDFDFADYYIEVHPVYKDEETGYMEGPDMYSGFAGSPYAGWGIYAPAMAKHINSYLKDVNSNQKAYFLEGESLPDLCKEYIDKDIPVAVWATTNMEEPYAFDTWTVNYVDENAKYKLGDSFSWPAHEHCLTLCGYDEKYYYFSDSVIGDISKFERALAEERYEQLGKQAIVVK